MAWFILQSERKTWTKFLVEAQDEAKAQCSFDDAQYLGYVDGEDLDTIVLAGPFVSGAEAFEDSRSYVEGH